MTISIVPILPRILSCVYFLLVMLAFHSLKSVALRELSSASAFKIRWTKHSFAHQVRLFASDDFNSSNDWKPVRGAERKPGGGGPVRRDWQTPKPRDSKYSNDRGEGRREGGGRGGGGRGGGDRSRPSREFHRGSSESGPRWSRDDRGSKSNSIGGLYSDKGDSRPSASRDNRGEGGSYKDRREGGRSGFQLKPWQLEEKTEPIYGRYEGDHLYGVNPVRAALKNPRRRFKELITQIDMDIANKKDVGAAQEILTLAAEMNIPVRQFSKHDLNMMTDNRLHQGFVLRAEPLEFLNIDSLEASDDYKVVLALDEVWDPQNFGALLRTSYFLGVHAVVVCAKNSAPLSAAVSKASSGAMELMELYSTNNLMKLLDKSKEQGWQVVGTEIGPQAIPFQQVPLQKPTILVLGNEGHGMRTNIVRRCDHLVTITKGRTSSFPPTPSPSETAVPEASSSTTDSVDVDIDEVMAMEGDGFGGSIQSQRVEANDVDSLNVSVTGGILLHHFLTKGGQQ